MKKLFTVILVLVVGGALPTWTPEARAEASGPVPGLGETQVAPLPKADDPNLPGRVDRRKKKAAYDKWAGTIAGGAWKHFQVSGYWGVMGTDASIMSAAVHWDPTLFESLDRSIGLRFLLGVLASRRLDTKAIYPIFEAGILASNRVSPHWRIEIGPTGQYWMTPGESFYPGMLLQLVLELDGGGLIDRLAFSFQPTLVKGVVAQLWRVSIGFQL